MASPAIAARALFSGRATFSCLLQSRCLPQAASSHSTSWALTPALLACPLTCGRAPHSTPPVHCIPEACVSSVKEPHIQISSLESLPLRPCLNMPGHPIAHLIAGWRRSSKVCSSSTRSQ